MAKKKEVKKTRTEKKYNSSTGKYEDVVVEFTEYVTDYSSVHNNYEYNSTDYSI